MQTKKTVCEGGDWVRASSDIIYLVVARLIGNYIETVRKRISDAEKLFGEAHTKYEEARSILEECRDEEQEYLDNMPESLQGGEKGSKASEAIAAMDTLVDEAEFPEEPDWETMRS